MKTATTKTSKASNVFKVNDQVAFFKNYNGVTKTATVEVGGKTMVIPVGLLNFGTYHSK